MALQPVRVLVVDDSAFMRHILSDHLNKDSGIEVVGTARDGLDGVQKVAELRPDIVTLDIEMPRLDGLAALQRIMREHPVPVIMVSALTQAGADATIRALELGAADVVGKPSGSISIDFDRVVPDLLRKVKRVARTARVARLAATPTPAPSAAGSALPSGARIGARRARTIDLCVIGSSTGGPRALTQVIPPLAADLTVPIVVVQHMPEQFTASLAKRLNELSELGVTEATDRSDLRRGEVRVARGGRHLKMLERGRVCLTGGAPVHGVRPSIDVFLESIPTGLRPRTLVVILTGMGSDGADGAAAIAAAGGYVVAEHESSCVIYGMPRAVVERDIAHAVVPLNRVAGVIGSVVAGRKALAGTAA